MLRFGFWWKSARPAPRDEEVRRLFHARDVVKPASRVLNLPPQVVRVPILVKWKS